MCFTLITYSITNQMITKLWNITGMNTVLGLLCIVVKPYIGKGATNTYWVLQRWFFFKFIISVLSLTLQAMLFSLRLVKSTRGQEVTSCLQQQSLSDSELLSLWTQMGLWILSLAFQVIPPSTCGREWGLKLFAILPF